MKIEEIIVNEFKWGALRDPEIPRDHILDKQHMGEYEGHSIHHFSWKGYHGLGVFNDDGTYRGYILLRGDKNPLVFGQAFVNENWRKRGIGTCLILFVLRSLNHTIEIADDEIITDDSRELFKALLKQNKITMTNTVTNNVVDYGELSRLFSFIGDNNIGFIVESSARRSLGVVYEIVDPDTGWAVHGSRGTIVRESWWWD
jgi:GNAT superfamily N-acetyltransferase